MNCLYTVNIGDFVTNYSRRTFQSACRRWGCDYAELMQTPIPGKPSTAKLFGCERLGCYETLFYVDGDCVVSETSPNPFELCQSDSTLYAVTDCQAGNPNPLWRKKVYLALSDFLKSHPELKLQPELESINSGVLLFKTSAVIRSLFDMTIRLAPRPCRALEEQSILNICANNTPGVRVQLLDKKWNHMIVGTNIPATNYINHFGGGAQELLKTL